MDERIDLTENRIFREKPKLTNAKGFNLKSKENDYNQWNIRFRGRIISTGGLVSNALDNMITLSNLEPIDSDNELYHSMTNYKKIYIANDGKIHVSKTYISIQQGYCAKCGRKTIIDYDLCSNCRDHFIDNINL